MGFYLNKKNNMIISARLFLMFLLVVVHDQLVYGQNGCFTTCLASAQHERDGPQDGRLQGPPGKRGPNGLAGIKGEKGEAAEFHSDAKSLAKLTTKFENLLTLTTKLESQLNQIANTCSVRAAGIEHSAIIEDRQLTVSSRFSYGGRYEPRHSRLHSAAGDGRGWLMDKPYKIGEWIQVDLKIDRKVHGVATQGCSIYDEYVTTYLVQFRGNGWQKFNTITNDEEGNAKIFNGNVAGDSSVVRNNFDEAITARYVRISPLTWHVHPYIRWEVYIS